jgi:hypothetical protein
MRPILPNDDNVDETEADRILAGLKCVWDMVSSHRGGSTYQTRADYLSV